MTSICGLIVAPEPDHNSFESEQSRTLLLIESISRNWIGLVPFKIYIIGPPSYITEIELIIKRLSNVTVVGLDARSLDSPCGVASARFDSWRRRHLLHMLACERVEEDSALLLSVESLSIRQFDEQTFINENKIVSEWESLLAQEWWRASAELLQLSQPDAEYGLSVWPNIISVALMREAISWISTYFGDLSTFLWSSARIVKSANVVWTDMSLYTLISLNSGRLKDYHVPASDALNMSSARLRSRASIWSGNDCLERLLLVDPTSPDAAFIHIVNDPALPTDKIRRLIPKRA